VALVAGDAPENIAMCTETHRRITAGDTTLIREIADTYADVFVDYRRKEVERKLLAPLGLTIDTYSNEPPGRVERLERALKLWELEDAALIVGADSEGVHIYDVSDPGWARCHDAIGFTAIGSGSGHAAAEFMRARFDKRFSVARTLLLAYRAKKAAEVDPFVGSTETDMFVLAPGAAPDQVPGLHADLYAEVQRVHNRLMKQDSTARRKADERIESSVEKHLRNQSETAVEQEGVQEGDGDEPKRLHDGSQEGEPKD
jgi:hypothetical protein